MHGVVTVSQDLVYMSMKGKVHGRGMERARERESYVRREIHTVLITASGESHLLY